jgi:Ser/Thr protein kinase RdoA (MazF antagonist)
MTGQQLEDICQRFRLGLPIAAPATVAGGHLHQMWHIETTHGRFAMKELNPRLLRQPFARAAYADSEQIAAAMAHAGIPAVPALLYRKQPVLKCGPLLVMVFPWVEGATLTPGPASPAQAGEIGALLGRMHALALALPGLELPAWRVWRDDDWVLLARRAAAARAPWADALRAMLRDLCWWSRLARDASPRLWQNLVVSHADLDQSNILWRDAETPLLVDWESAGYINPTLEVLDAALDWSGLSMGDPDEASFRALLAGYQSAGGTLHASIDDALAGVLGRWLGWLEWNLRRALDATSTPQEQASATSELDTALAVLPRLAAALGQVAGWVVP